MLEMTRALSSMGSPRPRWLSRGDKNIACPPSWYMPASKETRVRVDDFSKIIASSLPASGVCEIPCFSFCLTSMACAINARSSSLVKSSRLRK